MSKRESSLLGPAVLCAMVLLLAFGAFQIYRIRLVRGEFYPPWSSLRSEPDGTRLLFDSLAATGRMETVRKYKSFGQESERNATILYLGFAPGSLIGASRDDLEEFENAARSGNRVVVALDPGHWLTPPKEESAGPLAKRWGVGIDAVPGRKDATDLFFSKADGWTKDAAVNGRTVVIERAFGSGSIALASSSDIFSNQSLAGSRDSGLLIRLIGANTRVVFDESHLGVQDTGSVLGLVHKYRLDGALWGLLAIAIVFVWGHSFGFPPPDATLPDTMAGHDARSGLAQLLRRQIPVTRVVEACVFEWERANATGKLTKPGSQSDAVKSYRGIQQELTHK